MKVTKRIGGIYRYVVGGILGATITLGIAFPIAITLEKYGLCIWTNRETALWPLSEAFKDMMATWPLLIVFLVALAVGTYVTSKLYPIERR